MALKKQTIRKNMHILADGELITKEQLIETSESWSESQESMFRKCLKQGVYKFKIKGVSYQVNLDERNDINSKGNRPAPIVQIPGERTF
jgi:hypothetical protein|tara:strand:+ start:518 stop:784 length:267 start_codon:yes stop_codon:yes gene_type:complete